MSVSQRLTEYLTARFDGQPTDDLRKTLVGEAEGEFDAIRKDRQLFDAKWYQNQRFMDGDHYLVADPQTGKTYNQDQKGSQIKRSINVMKAQVRGLKNFVLKIPLTVEVSPAPADESDEAKKAAEQEARRKDAVVRALEYKLKLRELRRPVVDDGFIKNAGYIFVLPTLEGLPEVKWYDGYDVYPDSTAPSFYDGSRLYLATRQNVLALKSNKAYENTEEIKGDGRFAASTFKNNYEQSRSGASRQVMQGDLESVILKQLFVKFPYTIQPATEQVQQPSLGPDRQPLVNDDGQPVLETVERPVMGADGQPKQQLVPTDDGRPRIWIVSFTSTELHRVEETDFTRWPGIRYCPEQTGNRIHNNAWATDLQDPNRTVDNMFSKTEEWHIKSSPKLLVPSDSQLKEVTNITAEVLEYNPRKADGIKDYMPSGVPASMFTLINLAQSFAADVGGIHPASAGSVPVGVKSGRGIESLQAADAEFNLAEPMENFGLFWQEMWERIIEIVAENTTTQQTLDYPDNGVTKKVTFIGQAGLKLQNGNPLPAPPNTVVIGKTHVNVRAVPEVSYSEDGKKEVLLELYHEKAIDLQTLLEAYRFGNVGKIIQRVMAEKAQASQTPPPPPPVPGDRLLTALANIAKSGQPVTFDQLQSAMKDASLPPAPAPAPSPTSPQPPVAIDGAVQPAILE